MLGKDLNNNLQIKNACKVNTQGLVMGIRYRVFDLRAG